MKNSYNNFHVLDSAILKCFKTKKTPCVRNPQWEYKTSHKYVQPAGNHLHKLFSCLDFGGGKELKFYLWMSRYCPRQSDHLIAKVCGYFPQIVPLIINFVSSIFLVKVCLGTVYTGRDATKI